MFDLARFVAHRAFQLKYMITKSRKQDTDVRVGSFVPSFHLHQTFYHFNITKAMCTVCVYVCRAMAEGACHLCVYVEGASYL